MKTTIYIAVFAVAGIVSVVLWPLTLAIVVGCMIAAALDLFGTSVDGPERPRERPPSPSQVVEKQPKIPL